MSKTNPTRKKEKKKINKEDIYEVIIFLVIIFTLTFGTFAVLRIGLDTKLPMVVVISDSMEPTIYRGDLLFLFGKDPVDIQNGSGQGDPVGDIIVFDASWSYSGEPIVHRVIDKRSTVVNGEPIWEFQTQGDNVITNPIPDPGWVSEENIYGVVIGKVPKIGFVKIWLARSGATIPLIVGLSLILIISIAWDLTHPEEEEQDKKKKSKKRKDKQLPESESGNNDSSVNLGI
ncbi:MAG: signal peptidase I [Candidatus Lokiarchaeota archaeon]|nr:signal peptidase I [Candidatus Lokiarchaeota archaeon]